MIIRKKVFASEISDVLNGYICLLCNALIK